MSKYYKRSDVLQEVKAYIERAEKWMENDGYYEAQFEGFEELQDDLFNLPSVDIVKCIECKHYLGLAECELIDDCMGTNGFCAWGEPKGKVK